VSVKEKEANLDVLDFSGRVIVVEAGRHFGIAGAGAVDL
jgi:hypothetical protein